jgi:maltose alpha-D-glucosyltransferase/alpha-amylase
MKLVVGDALHSIGELGSKGLRLDANGFLGIEKSSDDTAAWSEGHPLSEAANQLIAGMVRKAGGFTFQELNLSIDDIKAMSTDGADLSYDFITRPGYHHALATGNTGFLRLCLRNTLEAGIDPASLVHALQNHDELTYELVHFWTVHKDDTYKYDGKSLKGSELRDIIRQDMKDALTGDAAPYNLLFTDNGIACTTASVITAVLGYSSLKNIGKNDIQKITKVHLLLAMFNALQPGVFALSGWDLCGALTVDPEENQVKKLIEDGDTRWVNRGAYDLMNDNPSAKQSSSCMPKANCLYGTLPEQLNNPHSFASQLKTMLAIREKYGIASSHQIDIPDVFHKALLVMVHRLNNEQLQVTVLNFSNETIEGTISSEHLPPKADVIDMFTEQQVASVDDLHSFTLTLHPYQGTSLLVT